MVDFRPLLFVNALALMLLVTAGFASIRSDAGHMPGLGGQPEDVSSAKVSRHLSTTPERFEPGIPQQQEPAFASEEASVFADVVPESTLRQKQEVDVESGQIEATVVGTEVSSAERLDSPAATDSATSKKASEKPEENIETAIHEAMPPQLAMAEQEMPEEQAVKTPLEPIPEPTTAQLTLRSNVVGDSVRINGKGYGATRLDLALEPGEYNVVISKNGYKDWSETVRLQAGDDLTLRGRLEKYTRVNYLDGQWLGGVRTGDGTYSGGDGLAYSGHFVDGQFDGRGIARYTDGSRYEGHWSAGERSGEGTFRAADGSTYIGQFDNDEFNGQGTLTRANGDVLTGQWTNGRLDGHSSLTTADGMLYVGGFRNGAFHGEGTLTYPDGRHYEGGFSNGEYHGEGSEIFANGKKYVGQYIEGDFHGKGTLMNPNGSTIEATFRYGEPYGQAKLTTPEGEVFNARTSEPGVCYRDKSYRATQCPPLEGW
ncbi:hypothetical protein RE428_19790 [Marinobacter nanhaiticus D15-8W]|uniref:PEGA domain-containing protein n=1 Tax=Marinobacter nanhaiticus D15-8W TaxID=626887 RepID=N6VTW2_9GAMM|nr:PEGA domain-containing protein [Marinobacter nanhaiticus]ENO13590.1 PEGA domain-containing protein [Marinobacter nanhaiticus D15-8W]BES70961.1 hypothetical protein RE428_19790 [Marinobacter nanhaiticus D15-8W]